jgi:hypothetical protein
MTNNSKFRVKLAVLHKLASGDALKKILGGGIAIGLFLGGALSPRPCAAQSFLEKLEAAVRQQVNSPASPAESKTPSPQTSSAVGEELPAPGGNQNSLAPESPGAASGPLRSILEGSSSSSATRPSRTESLQLTPSDNPPVQSDTRNQPDPLQGRGYLGVEVEEQLGGGIGVRVATLTENSPAWKAGFKVGDRIQGIDGHAIASISNMADRLARIVPGKPTKFLINRAGRNMELVAVLQDVEVAGRIQAIAPGVVVDGSTWLGVSVSDVTPAFQNQFGLRVFSGAAVTNVVSGSPAHLAGVRPGDAIVEVSGVPITNGIELTTWIARAQVGQPAELVVYRGSQRRVFSAVVASDPRSAPVVERPRSANSSLNRTANMVPDPLTPQTPLQSEVEQLRAQLVETQSLLLQTQQQLDEVMQRLEQSPQ